VAAETSTKVSPIVESFYAEWRVRSGVVPILREDHESPPEKLLQAIWHHQRVLRDQLKTLDGRSVRVLHPGFLNLEGGPDFRGAVIQLGEEPVVNGDVEVDLRASGWQAHGHQRNPAFRKVVLHVIWEGDRQTSGGPPTILLRGALDAPLGELSLWLGGDSAQLFPEEQRGKCCAPLRGLSAEQVIDLLNQAAHVRLRSKAAQFQARARQVGWEQALWEGVFRGLGYKHNSWPMQRLGELRSRWHLMSEAGQNGTTAPNQPSNEEGVPERISVLSLQARLLGLSGLLPVELTRSRTGTDSYLRGVWDLWWRERDSFSDVVLPRMLWRLHGLRPANHPQRRLALAAAWAATTGLATRIECWCAQQLATRQLVGSLLRALQVETDDFWSWHWTLNSPRFKKEQPLLGATRVTDLAVNVVLPWLWIRAVEGKNQPVQASLEQRYFNWPAAEDNSVLRLARQRLLGGVSRRALPGAATQQGLIQIIRDFCDHSNSICENCKLPELVQDFCREKSKIMETKSLP
jgi:hypothetical protein